MALGLLWFGLMFPRTTDVVTLGRLAGFGLLVPGASIRAQGLGRAVLPASESSRTLASQPRGCNERELAILGESSPAIRLADVRAWQVDRHSGSSRAYLAIDGKLVDNTGLALNVPKTHFHDAR